MRNIIPFSSQAYFFGNSHIKEKVVGLSSIDSMASEVFTSPFQSLENLSKQAYRQSDAMSTKNITTFYVVVWHLKTPHQAWCIAKPDVRLLIRQTC